MISLVVPTLWKYQPFFDFLNYLVKVDVVEEIIIIDNRNEARPNIEILNHNKIKLCDFNRNIKVNPAWNYGASIAKGNIVGFMNDDLVYDLKTLYKVNEFMESKQNVGTVGLSYNDVNMKQTPLTNGNVDFELFVGQASYGFGNLFFVNKDKWYPIPFGLDIWCGDVFVFDYFHFQGYDNYMIVNSFFRHNDGKEHGASELSQEIRDTVYEEGKIYEKIKEKLMNKIPL